MERLIALGVDLVLRKQIEETFDEAGRALVISDDGTPAPVEDTIQFTGELPHKHTVYFVWGDKSEVRDNPAAAEYAFDTLAELNAFLAGVVAREEHNDWNQFDTEAAALEYIEECQRDEEEE